MRNITSSLTRKFGPLPAWAYLVIFAVGVYIFRRKLGGKSTGTIDTGTGTGSVGPAPTTPQAPVTLQPGESVYDPNSGGLFSTPGGGAAATGTDSTDVASAINGLTAALAGQGTYTTGDPVNGGIGVTAPSTPAGHPATRAGHAQGHSSRYQGPGKYLGKLRFNPRKAGIKAKGHSAGYSGAGTYVRVAKPKAAHGTPKPAVKSSKPTRARSTATTKVVGHSARFKRTPKGSTDRKSVSSPAVAHTAQAPHGGTMIARSRPTTPATRPVVVSRPVATHPRPSAKSEPRPAPRPSSPPPRKATRKRGK